MILPETNDTIPLEDLLREFQGRLGEALAIVGGVGSGKTTALAHLAAVLAENLKISFLDEPSLAELYHALSLGAVVFTLREPEDFPPVSVIRLAPWTDDDLVEYLLARHPQLCASVMRRLQAAADRDLPAGLPELWRWCSIAWRKMKVSRLSDAAAVRSSRMAHGCAKILKQPSSITWPR